METGIHVSKWSYALYYILLPFPANIHGLITLKLCILALSGLLASLEESRRQLPSSEEEFGFLSGLLQSKELHALVKVHNKILENGKDDKLNPVLSSSMQVAVEVLEVILPRLGRSELCKELFLLLQKPHLQVFILIVLLHSPYYML